MAPHTPGVLRFGKLSKKPVAPAGYKNKQCRKQTSVLSGRIVTAYVPLRSATERERAAFLIPCQGLRGRFTNFPFIKQKRHTRVCLFLSYNPIINLSSAMQSFFKNAVKSTVWEQPDYFLRNYSFGQY